MEMDVVEGSNAASTSEHSSKVDHLFGLNGRTAIITGSSRGLGQHFAELLSKLGANVVTTGRDRDRLEATYPKRDRFHPVVADIRNAEDRERLISETIERFGQIDILINNAGILEGSGNPVEAFQQVLDVDLVAAFDLSVKAAPLMERNGGGAIVNVASVLGLVAAAPMTTDAYCAAKGGLINLTRQLGARWARKGVRVNALAPGFFVTEMSADIVTSDASRKFVSDQCPIGRLGEHAELDSALAFLVSPRSTYVTGQVISVDGGWTAR